MKKAINILFAFILSSVFPVFLAAEINFISPIKGNWSNKQMLVIEQKQDGDYFYSLDGSDPETFGFAYDGPVLLDVVGKIKLQVTHIFTDGSKEYGTVEYTVNQDAAFTKPYTEFIQSFYDSGILNYSAGTVIQIPSSLLYSLGMPPDSFLKGTDISLSDKYVLTRYIPCTLFDSSINRQWRFIIKTFPQIAGTYSRHDLPFTVTDWETINFTDNSLLFKIDGEYWYLPSESRKLDRTKSHMILWQSLDHKSENPIEFFVLPPKPEISLEKNDDGSFVYSLKGDNSYKLGILSASVNEYQELFSEICIDVFNGDRLSGNFNIGVYSSSVYQGEFPVDFSINKRPITSPQIISDSKSFYSRDKVHLVIEGDSKSDLYVAQSTPYLLSEEDGIPVETNEVLKSIEVNEYVYSKNHLEIDLLPYEGKPVFYKIKAYNKKNKIKSYTSEYSVIIDQYNYYFVENSNSENPDGTVDNPFNTFEQCINEIYKSDSVCLRVSGTLDIPAGATKFNKKLSLKGNGNAVLQFDSNSYIELENGYLDINGCRIERKSDHETYFRPMFTLKNSSLKLDSCQMSVNYLKNATVFDLSSSDLYITDSLASVTAASYTSFISSNDSNVNLINSNVNTIGETSVIISCNKGTARIEDCVMKVSGVAGRIAELYDVQADFYNNLFTAEISRAGKKFVPVFKNRNTVLNEKNNTITGF